MKQDARPQGNEEEDPKWPIDFNRQSLLTACWGSAKGADFLYHFLNKARWEIKNQKLAKSVKVIKFQEEKADILNSLKKADRFISQGMYSTMLRNFNAVGYVISQPYGTSYEVHLDVIENAFKQPPQKPEWENKQEKPSRKVSKMTDRHNDTISRTEYNSLVEVCVKLTDKCQSLTESVALLTSMCQSLTHQKSNGNTPQEPLPSSIWLQSNALEIEDDSEFFGARESENDQPGQSTTAEEKNTNQPTMSYSQETTQTNKPNNETQFELPTFYVVSPASWLQEETSPTTDAPSQVSVVVTQVAPPIAESVPLIPPADPKPASKHTFGNLREGLGERDVRQVSQKDQARMDAAEQREKERLAKKREQEIYHLFDKLFGSPVDRYGYNKAHVQSLSKNPHASNEIITAGFNAVANNQATKADPTRLTITNIANVIPALIRAEQIKVVSTQSKPESMDEREARIKASAKAFEDREKAAKAAREAQERMVAAQ